MSLHMQDDIDRDENEEEEDGDESMEFLPFHALNEFMRDDYRLTVLRSTLSALPSLSVELRRPVEELIRVLVRVPGFRDSSKAPLAARARLAVQAFEKSPEMVVAVLAAWAEAHADLRKKVFDLLVERGWEILPVDADRSQLPGFYTWWPKDEDFEVINEAFSAAYPEFEVSSDDVSLMVVWLTVSLPYNVEEEDDEDPEEETEDQEEE